MLKYILAVVISISTAFLFVALSSDSTSGSVEQRKVANEQQVKVNLTCPLCEAH